MFHTLSPGAIGVKTANLPDAIAKAKLGGFKGVEFSPAEVADLIDKDGAAAVKGLFGAAGIKPGGWGLPTNWRKDDATFAADLAKLGRLAKAASAIGCTRTSTWILSWDDTRPFKETWKFHVDRFTAMAK